MLGPLGPLGPLGELGGLHVAALFLEAMLVMLEDVGKGGDMVVGSGSKAGRRGRPGGVPWLISGVPEENLVNATRREQALIQRLDELSGL
jgi:hypothetical protein